MKSGICRTLAAVVFTALATAAPREGPDDSKGSRAAEDRWLAVQVFLDDAGFKPGVIDGKWGEFTAKALARYLRAQGKQAPAFGENAPAQIPELPLDANRPALTKYEITEADAKAVGPTEKEPAQAAKLKKLAYGSVAELVSEKFHAKVDLLKQLNPKAAWKAGESVQVPNVAAPFDLSAVEKLKAAGGEKEKKTKKSNAPEPAAPELTIVVDTTEKMLDLIEGEKVVASYPITPGSERLPAPKGEWSVERITWLPPFRWDKEMLLKGKRSSNAFNLPPGPNSPVGILWMQLSKEGIGIHGTSAPETIGRSESHGCIRLSNWDAFELGQKAHRKTKVTIR